MTWTSLLAQCVMCYRTAAAQQAERSRVLNHGILLLLLAPLFLAGVIVIRARASSTKKSPPDLPGD
ncbi:MAG: hypothetical protein ABJC09_12230 [Terriglobia bacterium]